MRSIIFLCAMMPLVCVVSVVSYPAKEVGVFDALLGTYQKNSPDRGIASMHVQRQKAAQHNDGPVFKIRSVDHFNNFVVKGSLTSPVIVNIHAASSPDSQKMAPIYQDLAVQYAGRVAFASLDLFEHNKKQAENYVIVMELMRREGLTRLDLPLFLFYKNGDLYRTSQIPVAMLQGFRTKENLEIFINQKFFSMSSDGRVVVHGCDFTVTPTER